MPIRARMAELADALDSGSSGVTPVQVQVLFLAPGKKPVTAGFFDIKICFCYFVILLAVMKQMPSCIGLAISFAVY